ncbi:Putative nucleolar protein [Heterostelium album PN500]|uniref:Nucleolar protein n=1 Tax=Heterostelium pallidum (strain ATCC 26659 / Pp 5 / PN500) TaxID=670386 RepID=D3BS35_HETP5|nr:Putative nucleolar protein [Heterostelium album PN500]EFA75772.1 Putative nucleolar protein [Heterostelium album PN500]|eukprot:XP_020427906.1 Putative nucleolar protein [Heterostelium album PN500]
MTTTTTNISNKDDSLNKNNDNYNDVRDQIDNNEGEENENVSLDLEKQTVELSDFLKNKPKEFIDFLVENDIPFDSYDIKEIPRFIRLNNRLLNSNDKQDINSFIKQLETELKTELIPLKWLPHFYKLSERVGIASSKSYKNGLIYGMDASSGAAILALDPQPGDNVLDICCAPGTKLSMIADMMNGEGTVTGVDISLQRLGSCKTILKKYKVPSARLFQCDGSTFNIKAPIKDDPLPFKPIKKQKKNNNSNNNKEESKEEEEEEEDVNNEEYKQVSNNNSSSGNGNCNKRRVSKKKTSKVTYDLDGLYFCNTFYMRYSNAQLYDKVIVDAECSLDASVRHLLQYSKLGRNFLPNELTELTDLQKRLIQTGFNLLKVGGSLVYSTCSFCKVQNEDVVKWLLDNNANAKLLPCFEEQQQEQQQDSNNNNNNDYKVPYSKGFIDNTYRFYPKNGTSGMFISKFTKI